MGKNKHRFNKKQSVRFTLVPGFDQNGKPTTLYRPMQKQPAKASSKAAKKLIQQISDYAYDEIQINGKMVTQTQIPAYILEQIKGRKDLIINQKLGFKHANQQMKQSMQEFQGDLYQQQLIDLQHEEDWGQTQNHENEEWDDEQYIEEQEIEQDQNWEDEDYEDIQIQNADDQIKKTQKFQMKEEDFPTLNKVTVQGKQYQLTAQQMKLLDVVLPENYENYEIQGVKFEKFNEEGLSYNKKTQYQKFYSTGKEGIVDSFDYVPLKPTPTYDTDLKPSEIVGDIKQIEDALNFQGEEQAYEQLEDDFFAKLIQAQIKSNQKNNKQVPKKKQPIKPSIKKAQKMSELADQKLKTVKIPKAKEQNQKNLFSKYDQLDEGDLQEQITQDMLDKALQDFQNNVQTKQKVKKQVQSEQQEDMDMNSLNQSNMSLNYEQIENKQEYIGRDGQLDWRCLTKKEKKQYMKTKIIKQFYDQVRERQISDKLKGKKNVTAEQLHLKYMIKHLTFEEDHVMRKALEEHAKEEVDMDVPEQLSSQSQEEDIVQYRQRTSIISSGLAQVAEPFERRKKKDNKKDDEQQSSNIQKIKVIPQKRDRNQTKQERKQRKQKLRELKKQKKQQKKQFAEQFEKQKRKNMKMNKPSDPLHKISYVKIM